MFTYATSCNLPLSFSNSKVMSLVFTHLFYMFHPNVVCKVSQKFMVLYTVNDHDNTRATCSGSEFPEV